jgi:RNA polymerase sigma-70 factor (ECF subfamily)
MVDLRRLPMTDQEPSGAESDEALMVRLMNGDLAGFDALYQRHASRIRGFIQRFVGDRDWADDLVQEVFLKVYRNPKAFDPRGRFLTWIYAVARNACIDFLRLKKLPSVPFGGGSRDDADGILEPATAEHEGPDSLALQNELEERMREVIGTLSVKLREVFVLCAVQGLSYEDAAEVIGCPVKTVSSRLSRARDRFLEKFGRFLGDTPLPAQKRSEVR